MLHIMIADDEFSILFKHDRLVKNYPANPDKQLVARTQAHPFKTSCVLFKNEIPLGTGVAKVDSRDQFEYERGRKISLNAALSATGLSKEDRTKVWGCYSDR